MRITRLYQNTPLAVGQTITLSPDKSHHLATVLRAKAQDAVILFNGDGYEYRGVVHTIHKKHVLIELQDRLAADRESPLTIHLAQGLCRGEKMDWVIQKSVELGVTEITPLLTEYSNVKLDAERADKKQQHWQQVLISACEQSGRAQLPTLHPPAMFHTWITQPLPGSKFLLHPDSSKSLPNLMEKPKHITVLIGSEGGFSATEVLLAQQQGFQSLPLGSRILRTETAPIAALSWAQTLWGDFPGLQQL